MEVSITMNIIETKNLTKSYADFTAVSGVSLHIPKGTVYGFLGPNGAGKSTTMKMFLGLTRPTDGRPRTNPERDGILQRSPRFLWKFKR